MNFDPYFAWVEESWVSTWVRGDWIYAFPLIITLHTIGMGFLAGTSAAIDLRILGMAPGVPLPALRKFYPLMWSAFAINAVSGVLLLIGYPTKALTNPDFYVKMSLLVLALVLLVKIRDRVLSAPMPDMRLAKRLAAASLLSWVGLITSGRLLAYTYSRLLVGVTGGF